MKNDYIFISNSTKPSEKEANSRENIKLTNVSRPCLIVAKEMGYNIILGVNRNNASELCCEEMELNFYDAHSYRSILAFKDNYIAYKNLNNLIKEKNVEVIHCNTPIGGFIGRICGKKNKVKKIIYTAHGFHFYNGAPLFNNIALKFIERRLAKWTDVIITMNEEDYQAARKFKLRNDGQIYKVHGVGINLSDFQLNLSESRKKEVRISLNLEVDDIAIIMVGDLIKRKNYEDAINAIAMLDNPKVKLFICGVGAHHEDLIRLIKKLNLQNQVTFLGFRNDIVELMHVMNIFLATSYQEGLPRALMEAMACGLPTIVSNIRGHIDLIENNKNGFVYELKNKKMLSEYINNYIYSEKTKDVFVKRNLEIIKEYDVDCVHEEIKKIYKKL